MSGTQPIQGGIGILFATGKAHGELTTVNGPLVSDALGLPALVLPVLGKPMLQRALEILIQQGCRKIHVILGEDAKSIRDFLDDGQRWGCDLEYHYQHPGETIGRLLMRIGITAETSLWLADAACLPLDFFPNGSGNFLFCHEQDGQPIWSGWCRLESRALVGLAWPLDGLGQQLLSFGIPAVIGSVLSALDMTAWHRGCLSLLASEHASVAFRQGKDSLVHASARIIPPVRIAENVRIGADCIIGPEAVIEAGSIIGKDTHLRHSIVLPDTFVGEHLSLTDCIVRGSRLANIHLGSLTEIRDRNVLTGSDHSTAIIPSRIRILAGLLRFALFPVKVLASLRLQGNVTAGNDAIQRPAPGHWLKHFTQEFYPGLIGVMRGKVGLVGPQARTAESIAALASPWQRLYHEHHPGLLQEALFSSDKTRHADDFFASDALAALQQQDSVATRKLLSRYLGRVMHELVK